MDFYLSYCFLLLLKNEIKLLRIEHLKATKFEMCKIKCVKYRWGVVLLDDIDGGAKKKYS